MSSEHREYFRIDDVIKIDSKKVDKDPGLKKSKLVAGVEVNEASMVLPDEAVHPHLWQMLVDINQKLGLILDKLNIEGEGLTEAEEQKVNISATGIRFIVKERVAPGDAVEIKMLLPSRPPVGVVTYGRVIRVDKGAEGEYCVAVNFEELEEDVREEIIQYTINRQREVIRAQKHGEA